MGARRNARDEFLHRWYNLPWNGFFWAMCGVLFEASAFFAYQAEAVHREQIGVFREEVPDLNDGDPITVALVLNGDEIIIEQDGKRARLRMLGIHSFDPVVNEREITAFGRASVVFLEERVLNKNLKIRLDKPKIDIHGRYLGYLELDGVDINQLMVEEGISMVYTEFPFAREAVYMSRENLARSSRRGLWGGAKATMRIKGLRRQWAEQRVGRGAQKPIDPVLWPTP
jgi:endonuclease YncB( thermonuclease family)